jgi:hypothetical protein
VGSVTWVSLFLTLDLRALIGPCDCGGRISDICLAGVSKGGTITVFRVVEEVELCLAEFKGQRRSPEVTPNPVSNSDSNQL